MIPPPVSDPSTLKKDSEQLQLLMIFHFIFGGFGVLGLGFLAVHFVIMQTVLSNPQLQGPGGGQPPTEVMAIFVVLYVVGGFFLMLGTALNFFSAVSIKQRRRRVLSLVTAGLNCLSFPFGTAMGVWTFIVLCRDSVKSMYS